MKTAPASDLVERLHARIPWAAILLAILGACLNAGARVAPARAAPDFLVETVHTAGSVGASASLALDSSGTPHVAYFDATQQSLFYATLVNDVWVIDSVAGGPGWAAGEYCSLALDSQDRPHIAYYFQGTTYGNGPALAIKDAGAWSIEAVTQLGDTGRWISLDLDDSDVPHLAYHDDDVGALRYATKSAGSWQIELVDDAGDTGFYTDIAVDTGGAVTIAYHNATDGSALFAYKSLGPWTRETIATGRGDTWGLYNELGVDTHGIAHAVFYRYEDVGADYDVVYAYRSGTWQTEVVASSATLGTGLSMTLAGSTPHLACVLGGTELHYAVRTGAATWSDVLVTGPSAPAWPSVALDASNRPRFAFQEEVVFDLEYAFSEWTDVTPADLAAVTDGSGVAWGDYDLDGLTDLYVGQFGAPNVLLQNGGGLAFTDVTSGLEGDGGGSNGSAWGDFDDDTYLDLYIADNPEPNVLLKNEGGFFSDWTIPPLDPDLGGFVVSWVDYDVDGNLDLYLSNLDQPNLLIRNLDGGWTFVDVTPAALALTGSQGVAWGDADGDGDQDLFVGTTAANKLFRNDGGGLFADVSGAIPGSGATRGAAWGDYDNDGDLDLYVTQGNGPANQLLRNDGGFVFTDVTAGVLGDASDGADVAFLDYDNDADLDLFVSNLGSDNKLFRNDGGGTWTDVTHGPVGHPGYARGAAWADADQDGDLDLALTDIGNPALLVRNDVQNGNHWLHVDLRGTVSNRYGLGARIRVTTGAVTQIREVTGGEGLNGQNSYTAEFGLGDATSIDAFEVFWPSGIVQTVNAVSVDSTIEVVEQDLGLAENAWTFHANEMTLYAADLEAGIASAMTDPLPIFETDVQVTTGPGGILYALGGGMDADTLYRIDPVTSSAVEITLRFPYLPSPSSTDLRGIAWDPLENRLYTTIYFIYDDTVFLYLATVDPTSGWVKPVGLTTFVGATPAYDGLSALAFDVDGQLYGIDNPVPSPFRFWKIDKHSNLATFLGANQPGYLFSGDVAFVGGELWVERGSVDHPTFARFSLEPGTVGDLLQETTIVIDGLTGLSQRLCTASDPELVAEDVPDDAGGHIRLDWSAYAPPPDVDSYEILRSTDPCDLQPIASVGPGATEFVDASAVDYVAYTYGVRVNTAAAQGKLGQPEGRAGTTAVAATLVAGPVTCHPNLVINEFAPAGGVPKQPGKRIGELVEIRNLADVELDLTGFRLSNGPDAPTPDEETLPSVTIPAGGLYVHTLTAIDLPDPGGTLLLLPPDPTPFALDVVSYGTQGGAPTVPSGFTVSRVEGTDAGDPDASSFEAGTSTMGQDNTVPAPALGSSLQINEVLYTSSSNDHVELYNPLGTVVNLSQFALSDGVNFLVTLTQLLPMQPGAMAVVDQLSGGLPQSIDSPQLYLYKVLDTNVYQRVDQLGWTGGPTPVAPNDALLRVPDGSAVYLGDQGTNWAECGGGTSLLYGPHSPGLPNDVPGQTTYVVDPDPGAGDYTTIGAALAQALVGTRILVRPGTYNESIALQSGVEIVGLAGAPDSVVIAGAGSLPAVSASGVDASAKLSGVAIVGATATDGAALHLTNSSPLVRNVQFKQNIASNQGGAVYVSGLGQPLFDGCLFEGNEAGGHGGAVTIAGGTPVFRACLFAANATLGNGGGLYNVAGNVTVEHCVFDLNTASGPGAGILHSVSGTIDATYTTVTNSADGSPLMAETGSMGTVQLMCGDLYGHSEWFKMVTVGVDTSLVVMDDPAYCDPENLDYAYGEASPLATPPSGCAEFIGIAGPPCLQPTSVRSGEAPPGRSRLLEPAPNPFNPMTMVPFELDRPGRAWVTLFDLRGRRVAELVGGRFLTAGSHRVTWEGRDDRGERVASGVYLARLRLDGRAIGAARKLVLLK